MNEANLSSYIEKLDEMLFSSEGGLENDKQNEIIQKIINNIGIDISQNSECFKKKILKSIKKITSFKLGQRLIEIIFEKTIKPLKIEEGNVAEYSSTTNTITMQKLFADFFDGENSTVFFNTSFSIVLFHELVHAMHFLSQPKEYISNLESSPASDWQTFFHNLEEEQTILGLRDVNENAPISICENLFRRHLGKPLRFSHLGGFKSRIMACENITLLDANETRYSFKHYLKKLPKGSIKRKYMITDDAFRPTPQQKAVLKELTKCGITILPIKNHQKWLAKHLIKRFRENTGYFSTIKEVELIIEKNIPIEPENFKKYYTSFLKQIHNSFLEKNIVIDVPQPNPQQQELINIIKTLGVKVHNSSLMQQAQNSGYYSSL